MSNLQEAFREAARREFAMVPTECELDYSFSPGFQRKMRRIIRAQVHGYWQFVNTTAKRIACVAAIIVMLLTTAMAIKPVRERVIKFFIEVYEEYFEITFKDAEPNDLSTSTESMVRYTFLELPQGYYEEKYVEANFFLWTFWKNNEGLGITLRQESGTQNITLDYASTELTTVDHNKLNIAIQDHPDASSYVWTQDGYTFHLTVHAKFSITQILALIDSLAVA